MAGESQGNTFVIPGANKFSRSESKSQSRARKVGLDRYKEEAEQRGLSEADKLELEELEKERAAAEQELSALTTPAFQKDGAPAKKTTDDYKQERIGTSDTLAQKRSENLATKEENDKTIGNRRMIDGIIKGAGSIAAGLVGHATKTSVGDKYKYDSYDPTVDARANERSYDAADSILKEKYGRPITESKEQQDVQIKALEERLKTIKDKIEAKRKASTQVKSGTERGNNEAMVTESDSSSWSQGSSTPVDGGGKGGKGSAAPWEDPFDQKVREENKEITQFATNKVNALGDAATDEQKIGAFKETFRKGQNKQRVAIVIDKIQQKYPDATYDEVLSLTTDPFSQNRLSQDDDVRNEMLSALGAQKIRNTDGSMSFINPSWKTPATSPAATQPSEPPATSPVNSQPAEPPRAAPSQSTPAKSKTGANVAPKGLQKYRSVTPNAWSIQVGGESLSVTDKGEYFIVRNSNGIEKKLTREEYRLLESRKS